MYLIVGKQINTEPPSINKEGNGVTTKIVESRKRSLMQPIGFFHSAVKISLWVSLRSIYDLEKSSSRTSSTR